MILRTSTIYRCDVNGFSCQSNTKDHDILAPSTEITSTMSFPDTTAVKRNYEARFDGRSARIFRLSPLSPRTSLYSPL